MASLLSLFAQLLPLALGFHVTGTQVGPCRKRPQRLAAVELAGANEDGSSLLRDKEPKEPASPLRLSV